MLTLRAPQAETLWDELLPVEARELPDDLARIDELLSDPELLRPIAAHWRREVERTGRAVLTEGRPTIAMETYVRLMVVKQRSGWGYETLVREVSDSLHLRRFCLIPLNERVPDESTVRKLTRRLGADTVAELTRVLIEKAVRERRFRARAVRIDSTVVEADVGYPTDSGLAAQGVRALAREGRSGEAKAEVLKLTAETGALLERSVGEARRLAAKARARARGRGARAKLRAAAELERLADRCERVASQIKRRMKGEPITDRPVSLADPDARPIRKGKLGKPNEFGYVTQLAEVTENTRRGARGLILAPVSLPGNPKQDALLPQTVAELARLELSPREIALDGGFNSGPTREALAPLAPERVFISGRQQPGSKRTQRRLRRYRTGAEGRISHLKRRYGLRRSRLKGQQGQQTWTGWAILAYNLDTLAVRTA